jgi:hypothetical protein
MMRWDTALLGLHLVEVQTELKYNAVSLIVQFYTARYIIINHRQYE